MKVIDGEQLIGKTGPKSYLCWERNPGAVLITGKAENKSTVSLNAEAGQAYYIQQHVRMGILFGSVQYLSHFHFEVLHKICSLFGRPLGSGQREWVI